MVRKGQKTSSLTALNSIVGSVRRHAVTIHARLTPGPNTSMASMEAFLWIYFYYEPVIRGVSVFTVFEGKLSKNLFTLCPDNETLNEAKLGMANAAGVFLYVPHRSQDIVFDGTEFHRWQCVKSCKNDPCAAHTWTNTSMASIGLISVETMTAYVFISIINCFLLVFKNLIECFEHCVTCVYIPVSTTFALTIMQFISFFQGGYPELEWTNDLQ